MPSACGRSRLVTICRNLKSVPSSEEWTVSLPESLIVMRINRLTLVVFIVITAAFAEAQSNGGSPGWSTAAAPYVSEASGSVLDANGATATLRAAQPPPGPYPSGSVSMRVPAGPHRLHSVTLTADLSSTDATSGA